MFYWDDVSRTRKILIENDYEPLMELSLNQKKHSINPARIPFYQ
jgi:hypothetical protein